MVVTLITVTPKISSMAFFISILFASLATSNTYFLDVQILHGLLSDDGPDDDIIRILGVHLLDFLQRSLVNNKLAAVQYLVGREDGRNGGADAGGIFGA